MSPRKAWWWYLPSLALTVAFGLVIAGVFEIRGYKFEVKNDAEEALAKAIKLIDTKSDSIEGELKTLKNRTEIAIEEQKKKFRDRINDHVLSEENRITNFATAGIIKFPARLSTEETRISKAATTIIQEDLSSHAKIEKQRITRAANTNITTDIKDHLDIEKTRITNSVSESIQKDVLAHAELEKQRITLAVNEYLKNAVSNIQKEPNKVDQRQTTKKRD